jgi:pSer/pThr/pTyr-binding forkhead associated (FHA) protein
MNSPYRSPRREVNHSDAQVRIASDAAKDTAAAKQPSLVVSLIVGFGTHAGVSADIREGIYMIGRDRECQIRPKSHSVSERHCLVQHHSETVRVFDLESEKGTFVNDVRLQPKTWQILNHGDRLRCGKYWFDVAIYLREPQVKLSQLDDGSIDESGEQASDESIDVASMEVESESRAASDYSLMDESDFAMDEFTQSSQPSQSSSKAKSPSKEDVAPPTSPASTGTKPAPTKPTRLPKPKITHKSSSSGWQFSLNLSGPDSLKVWVACIAMVATVGYLGWSLYDLKIGNQPKIVRGID